jgi:hypothetical protein
MRCKLHDPIYNACSGAETEYGGELAFQALTFGSSSRSASMFVKSHGRGPEAQR